MALPPAFLAVSVFLLGVATATGIFLATFTGNQSARLTGPFAERNIPRSVLQRESVEWPGLPRKLLQWHARRLRETPSASRRVQRTQKLLVYAGFNALDAVLVFRLTQIAAAGVGVAGGILTSFALHKPRLACAILGGTVAYIVTEYVLRKLGAARQAVLARELPAALDLLVVSLEAGLGIGESIKVIGRETERQGRLLGAELSTVSAEMGAGLSLEDALRNLDERTGVEDIKSLAALIVQCEKMGGRLGPALRSSSELLTTKRRLRAEENAQKSAIKMLIPLVLLILPAMMIVILGPAVIQIIHVLGASAQ
jgi:tight adherence protein C